MPGLLDPGFEHLCGTDDGLAEHVALLHICFLAINTFSLPSFCQVLDFLLNLNLGDDPLSIVTQSAIMSLNMNECVIGFQLL